MSIAFKDATRNTHGESQLANATGSTTVRFVMAEDTPSTELVGGGTLLVDLR